VKASAASCSGVVPIKNIAGEAESSDSSLLWYLVPSPAPPLAGSSAVGAWLRAEFRSRSWTRLPLTVRNNVLEAQRLPGLGVFCVACQAKNSLGNDWAEVTSMNSSIDAQEKQIESTSRSIDCRSMSLSRSAHNADRGYGFCPSTGSP
jgi:hypothetical protein